MTRLIKYGIVSGASLIAVGALIFGADVFSYASTTAKGVQSAVKDNVPLDFELRRARDLLTEIMPEMHANIKLIAQEEVEIKSLQSDIEHSRKRLTDMENKVAHLRNVVDSAQVVYSPSGSRYTQEQLTEELERRFDHVREARLVLEGKQKLLDTRRKSLDGAVAMLEKTRSRKVLLEQKIESLEGQYRLVKAASVGSKVQFDNSKLAQTEKLITDIKKRLDTAERVLAHESRFTGEVEEVVLEQRDVVSEIDEYFGRDTGDVTRDHEINVTPESEDFGPVSRAYSNN